ncbi:hypothetical protein PC119_g16828 [Phytophthora cactorum]|uniref:Uncharacterized protein n=1 Tax=Phytophthora cactorum TaxID=29920 RepID=A0A8T1CBQ0_9STRA|nr:hypothetical protein PC112_g15845 [Phytophthora cactorum]KAG2814015.1 hypothetical protein PC111_g14158 [Phytophthora cactorum]KAG2856772.1 hypothetical protein PC113_g11289 [Phytophthora cactorum]KAG2890193.1 hypothetical protein PC114_g17593 [Phytophthora cactorum]KAG2903391.1 hypothetical protein PC115_g15336 [Phytophthora cactorum]
MLGSNASHLSCVWRANSRLQSSPSAAIASTTTVTVQLALAPLDDPHKSARDEPSFVSIVFLLLLFGRVTT